MKKQKESIVIKKDALVERISKINGSSKTETAKFLKAFQDVVSQEVSNGNKVQLIGFGTFETRQRKARVGRNPKSGEAMNLPSSISPVFKAGKSLKDMCNAQ